MVRIEVTEEAIKRLLLLLAEENKEEIIQRALSEGWKIQPLKEAIEDSFKCYGLDELEENVMPLLWSLLTNPDPLKEAVEFSFSAYVTSAEDFLSELGIEL